MTYDQLLSLSQHNLNVELAKIYGWKLVTWKGTAKHKRTYQFKKDTTHFLEYTLPKYASDPLQMSKVESLLTPAQEEEYEWWLKHRGNGYVFKATMLHRAFALVLILNKIEKTDEVEIDEEEELWTGK